MMETKAYAEAWTEQFKAQRWCGVCSHANNLAAPYVWCKKDHAHYEHNFSCKKWEGQEK